VPIITAPEDDSMRTGVIVAIVIGSVIATAVITAAILYIYFVKKSNQQSLKIQDLNEKLEKQLK